MTVTSTIYEQGVVAIVRSATAEAASENVATLIAAGLKIVEVSLVTPGALDVVRDAAASAPEGVFIGVGTALTGDDVRDAHRAGASFVVSPILAEEVVKGAIDLGMTTLPGVGTTTEMLQAMKWGSGLVKIFPASLWSPVALREILTALPDVRAVPTGGVTLDSAAEWIGAGAFALGIGSTLTKSTDPAAVARGLLDSVALARQ